MARHSHDGGRAAPSPFRCGPIRITGPVKLWIVCDAFAEVTVHWDGRRSSQCCIPPGQSLCPGCVAEYPRKVQYWLAVQDHRITHRPRLLMLTPGAIESCKELVERQGDLWGRLLSVWRKESRPNAPMGCRIVENDSLPALADPVDVLDRLRRMWSAPDRHNADDVAPRKGVG